LELRKKEILENNLDNLKRVTTKARYNARSRLNADISHFYFSWTFSSHARDVISSELTRELPDAKMAKLVAENFVEKEIDDLYAKLPFNKLTITIILGLVILLCIIFLLKTKK